jgi:hypothetical protein
MDRKTFIHNAFRILISSGFVILVSALAGRQKISFSGKCDVQPYCKKCRLQRKCNKPQAIEQLRNE